MPSVMKGLEKSMTFSLSEVMVKAATAKSAFCSREKRTENKDNTLQGNADTFSMTISNLWPDFSSD